MGENSAGSKGSGFGDGNRTHLQTANEELLSVQTALIGIVSLSKTKAHISTDFRTDKDAVEAFADDSKEPGWCPQLSPRGEGVHLPRTRHHLGSRRLVRHRTVNSHMFPIIKVEMEDFQKEDWVSIYQSALTELEHARISGRIEAAQKAIVSRMEKLLTMPGLHPEERHAIEDAIRILGILEREEARYDAEQKRLAVGSLLEKLRSVGFTIQRYREPSDYE